MAISDGHGLPLAVHVASASPHETRLVEATLENRFFADLPERLIGDRAYDSDQLDERLLMRYGIEMIAPHTTVRTRTLTQDGRPLRRYAVDGKSNACLRGCITIAASWSAGNVTQTISWE
jgi:Transposase DDE domain